MAEERVSIVIRARDFASRVMSKVGSAGKRLDRVFGVLKRTFRTLAIGVGVFTGALVGSVLALGRLATKGGDVLNVQRAFARVTGDVTGALKILRRETFGLIDNYELMKGLNNAITLGSAQTTEQFADLAKTAIQLGRALGIDAAFALNSLNTGIARQSRLFLDNIGIIISVGEANERYARILGKTANQLTDAEKREAFRTAALEKAREAIEKLGGVQLTGADRVRQAGVAVKNFTTKLAAMAAQSPFVEKLFAKLGSLTEDLTRILGGQKQDIVDTMNDLGAIAGNSFVVAFLKAIEALGPIVRSALSKIFIDPKAVEVFKNLTGAGGRPVGGPGDTRPLVGRFLQERGIVAREPTSAADRFLEKIEAAFERLAARADRIALPSGAPAALLGAAPTALALQRQQFGGQLAGVVGGAPGGVVPMQLPQLAARLQESIVPLQQWIDLQSFAKDVIESTLTPQEQYNKAVLRINEAYGLGLLSSEQYERGVKNAGDAMEKAGKQAGVSADRIVLAFGRMAEQIIGGLRGGGGFLSGLIGTIGGLASVVPGVGQLAGAGILAGSGIFSALARPSRDRPRVIVDSYGSQALSQLQQLEGPSTVILQLIQDGVTIEEIEYELRRRQNTDQVIRIPRGVKF